MNGLIFDDATCEFVAPPVFLAPPAPRARDYIIVGNVTVRAAPRTSMAEIRDAVAAHYGLARGDMVSARRCAAIARPRQLAMYLCRHSTDRSWSEIGRAFGGRDHTTVIHAARVVEARLSSDPDFRADHDAIVEALGE